MAQATRLAGGRPRGAEARDERIDQPPCECGHGRFTWTFTVDVASPGTEARKQVRRGGFDRKQDAIDALQAELVDRRRGTHLKRTSVTFGEYASRWLEERARARLKLGQLAETTFAIYERDLRNHLRPALGDIPLQELDGEQDGGEHVVEVVRDAAGESADALHALGAQQLRLDGACGAAVS